IHPFPTHMLIIVSLLLLTTPPSSATYTLSLHDALPIYKRAPQHRGDRGLRVGRHGLEDGHERRAIFRSRHADEPAIWARLGRHRDRKSTRLNSSHQIISYAVFCLKKKRMLNSRTRLYVR